MNMRLDKAGDNKPAGEVSRSGASATMRCGNLDDAARCHADVDRLRSSRAPMQARRRIKSRAMPGAFSALPHT